MENNSIPPISYKKLVKKVKKSKIILLIFVLLIISVHIYFIFEDMSLIRIFQGVFILFFIVGGYLIWHGKILSYRLFMKMMKEMAAKYNWVIDKKLEDKSWNFMNCLEIEHLPIIPSNFTKVEQKFILCGKFCNRDFSFYGLTAHYGKSNKEEFVLIKTNPIANFNNVILIHMFLGGGRDINGEYEMTEWECKFSEKFQEVKLETQDMFDIYSTDCQKATEFLSQDFINALIKYKKTTYDVFSILITPQGILITKLLVPNNISSDKSQSPSLCFTPADKYVFAYWQSTENFIKLLDLINLLEKK